ncbi:MAG: hypothetical protein VW405_03125 [Rhodospirillaceae bacterium]
MGPIAAAAIPAIVKGGFDLFGGLFGNRSQSRINQQSLAAQLQMFREQQAFLQQQAAQDQRNWLRTQAEDTRRYNEMMGMQREQWNAREQQRAPYRAGSQNLLRGAFGGGSIAPYPGGDGSLGALMGRG